jgi:hypothetical protein
LLILLAVCVAGCTNDVAKTNRIQRMLLEPARAAEERGDDVAAFRNYLSAAKDGVVYAQLKVASLARAMGPGVKPRDDSLVGLRAG